eukprot:3664982-Rhodomonas_salina.2
MDPAPVRHCPWPETTCPLCSPVHGMSVPCNRAGDGVDGTHPRLEVGGFGKLSCFIETNPLHLDASEVQERLQLHLRSFAGSHSRGMPCIFDTMCCCLGAPKHHAGSASASCHPQGAAW